MTSTRRDSAWIIALVVVAGGLLAAQSAQGRSRAHLLAVARYSIVTDSARYAAYVSMPGALSLLDTKSGRTRVIQTPPDCYPQDASRGYFLVNCRALLGDNPFVLNARLGTMVPVGGAGKSYFVQGDGFGRIGSRWVGGSFEGRSYDYVNWRTGVVRFGDLSDQPFVVRDLNSANLRPLAPPDTYGVGSGRLTVTWEFDAPGTPLILHAAGRPDRVLDRCDPPCSNVTIGGGFVTWERGYFEQAYAIKTGRRQAWTLAESRSLRHTANSVFFNVPVGPFVAPTSAHIYETRL